MTPARSKLFIVRSKWSSDVDSGKNSASAIAPAEVMDVDDRNKRFNASFKVNAVLSD